MQYIGNKQSLVPSIHNIMLKHNIFGNTICDAFAGTHSVGSYFKDKGFTVYANDWQAYSYVMGRAFIENIKEPEFNKLINTYEITNNETNPYKKVLNYLNNLEGIEGFFYKNYCPTGTQNDEYQRLYFSDVNGKKFDAIRTKISEWFEKELISNDEYYILVATSINALDAVSNTTSVYGAFLKHMKGASLKNLSLQPLNLNLNGNSHKVYQLNAVELAKEVEADIFYLDPPYNSRQYSSNYHVLETAALYDNPNLHGKTGLRNYDHQKSEFSSKAKVKLALKELIENIKSKYIILSYNDEGILSHEDIIEIFETRGEVIKEEIEYKRYKSDKNGENRQYKDTNTVKELLYILKVNQ